MTCCEIEHQSAAQSDNSSVSQNDHSRATLLFSEQSIQQQRLDAVGSLACGIAHEFNNLLQAIRAYTLFAVETLPTKSPAYRDLQKVLRAAERATGLTRQLLDFSRAQESDLQQCEIDPVLQEMANLICPLLPAEIELELQLRARQALVVIDVQLIHQALMNLCLNARDAMPTGGRLSLRSDLVSLAESAADSEVQLPPTRYVRLEIQDTGTGIPEEVQTQMFDPFYTTKEVGKGTGLGLSVTHGVVQQMGGQIRFVSEAGQGTTFSIYLPIADNG